MTARRHADELGYLRFVSLGMIYGHHPMRTGRCRTAKPKGALDSLGNYAMHYYIRIDEPRHAIFDGFEETPSSACTDGITA
jgi:hypothetical protein